MKKHIWLRHETKPFEKRSALTPTGVSKLLSLGHKVTVEKSEIRSFSIEEYAAVGAEIVETNSWISDAPKDAIIYGLKEFCEQESFKLHHTHIHFAHVYKGQIGSENFLKRFAGTDGKLIDLEYLVYEDNKRIAAFGVWAGFVGAALGVKAYALKMLGKSLNSQAPLKSYTDKQDLIDSVKADLSKISKLPKSIIIGGNGRCGIGAKMLLSACDLKFTSLGSKETKIDKNLEQVTAHQILINTAFINSKVTPFISKEQLVEGIDLKVISDVGCDPNSDYNPIPVYSKSTTLDRPISSVSDSPDVDITAIDHLPSLLPRESSLDFEEQILPHLINFLSEGENEAVGPYTRALNLFKIKMNELSGDTSKELNLNPVLNQAPEQSSLKS